MNHSPSFRSINSNMQMYRPPNLLHPNLAGSCIQYTKCDKRNKTNFRYQAQAIRESAFNFAMHDILVCCFFLHIISAETKTRKIHTHTHIKREEMNAVSALYNDKSFRQIIWKIYIPPFLLVFKLCIYVVMLGHAYLSYFRVDGVTSFFESRAEMIQADLLWLPRIV